MRGGDHPVGVIVRRHPGWTEEDSRALGDAPTVGILIELAMLDENERALVDAFPDCLPFLQMAQRKNMTFAVLLGQYRANVNNRLSIAAMDEQAAMMGLQLANARAVELGSTGTMWIIMTREDLCVRFLHTLRPGENLH